MPNRRFPSGWVLARMARDRDEDRAQALRVRGALQEVVARRDLGYPALVRLTKDKRG